MRAARSVRGLTTGTTRRFPGQDGFELLSAEFYTGHTRGRVAQLLGEMDRPSQCSVCMFPLRGDKAFGQESRQSLCGASSQLAAPALLRNLLPQPARGSGAGTTRQAAKAAKEEQPRASAPGTKPIQQGALTGRHRTKSPPTRGAFTKADLHRPAGCGRKSDLGRSGNSTPVPSPPWLANASPSLMSTPVRPNSKAYA